MQAANGNDASPPSSPTAALGSQRCVVSCPVLISRIGRIFSWADLPAMEEAAWQPARGGKCNEPAHRW